MIFWTQCKNIQIYYKESIENIHNNGHLGGTHLDFELGKQIVENPTAMSAMFS